MSLAMYVILLCYMVAAVAGHLIFWHKQLQWQLVLKVALWSGFVLQLFLLGHDILKYGHVWGSASFNFVFVLVSIWVGAMLLWQLRSKKTFQLLFAGPFALVCLVALTLFPGPALVEQSEALRGVWLSLHVHLLLLAYALLGLGFIAALSYLVVSKMLQHKKMLQLGTVLPLESLDRLVNRLNSLGVLLLILGLFSGAIWGFQSWTGHWVADPKIVASILACLAYVGVISFKLRRQIQGRQSMWWIMGCFLLLLSGLLLDQLIPSAYHQF